MYDDSTGELKGNIISNAGDGVGMAYAAGFNGVGHSNHVLWSQGNIAKS